jgi:hypothetical protein
MAPACAIELLMVAFTFPVVFVFGLFQTIWLFGQISDRPHILPVVV